MPSSDRRRFALRRGAGQHHGGDGHRRRHLRQGGRQLHPGVQGDRRGEEGGRGVAAQRTSTK